MSRSRSVPISKAALPDPGEFRPPEPLGLLRSFGFGDPLGLATAGHVSAAKRFSIAPVLLQAPARESGSASTRTPGNLISLTAKAVAAAHFSRPWGADADRVKTETDVERMTQAGFSWLTLDPSAFIENRADRLPASDLAEEIAILGKEGLLPPSGLAAYPTGQVEVAPGVVIEADHEQLARAAIKFARALHHAQKLARAVSAASTRREHDIELALVDCSTPAGVVDHLFVGLEARRRGLAITSLALRWDPGLEPAIDVAGDLAAFGDRMQIHSAIARHAGPYKISVHDGDDKLRALPAIARACGERLHLKTSGASFRAALRVVCRNAPDLFREIAAFARSRFATERNSSLISTTQTDVDRLFRISRTSSLEEGFLESSAGRQMLDTTARSILQAGLTSRGRPFREAIVEVVLLRRDDYQAMIEDLFTRHLAGLNEG